MYLQSETAVFCDGAEPSGSVIDAPTCGTPSSRRQNQIMKLIAIPWIADRAIGSDLADNLMLRDYDSVR